MTTLLLIFKEHFVKPRLLLGIFLAFAIFIGNSLVATPAKADAPGAALLQFIHASPDAPAIDIYLGTDTSPLFDNYQFTDFSPYFEVTAGRYDISVRLAG